MSRSYSAEEILRMAVKKLAAAPEADLNGDGRVTSEDARLADRADTLRYGGTPETYAEAPQTEVMRTSLLDRMLTGAGTDFRVNADRLYDQYREMYTKNASLAAENVYGLASANTGGYGNSYAASAASQAYSRYMEGLTDRAQSIEAQALERQQAAFNMTKQALSAVNEADEARYRRYQDDWELAFRAASAGDTGLLEALGLNGEALNAKNNRSFASLAAGYGDMSYLKALGVDTSVYEQSEALKKAVTAAGYGDYSLLKALGVDTSAPERTQALKNAVSAAQYGDYSYLNALGVDTAALRQSEAFQRAVSAAEYGDYSYLKALGVNTDTLQYAKLLDIASQMAKYGDDSALEALGVDVSRLREEALLDKAVALAAYGDYSLLGSLSENLSGLKQKVSVTVQNGAEEAYAYGGYAGLVRYLNRQIGYGQITEETKKQIVSLLTGGGYGA